MAIKKTFTAVAPKKPTPVAAPKPKAPAKIDPKVAELAKVRDYYAKNGHVPTILANISKQYFGSANAADLGDLGKRVALGQMSLDQAKAAAQGGTSNLDPYAKRAGLAASVEIDPQVKALQSQAQLGQQGYDRANQLGEQQNKRTVAEQQEIYRRLAEQLGMHQPEVNKIYDAGEASSNAAYDALKTSLDQNYGGAIGSTNNEATRLGLQAALPVATGDMASDQAFLKSVAGIQQQGQQGTLENQRNASLSDLIAGMAQSSTEGAALSGKTLRDYAQQSAEERFRQQQEMTALQQQAAALEGTRTGRVFEGTQSLQQAAAQQAYEQQQDAIANAIARQKADAQSAVAGADQYRAESDRQYKQGMLGVANADSMTKAQIAQATIGKTNAEKQKILDTMTPGTPAYQELASKISLQNAQAAKAISDAATNKQNANTNASKAAANTNYGKGLAGSNKYLTSVIGGNGAVALGQVVNHAFNKYPPSSDKKTNDSNFTKALREARSVIQKQTKDQKFHNAVDSAIAIAYGK